MSQQLIMLSMYLVVCQYLAQRKNHGFTVEETPDTFLTPSQSDFRASIVFFKLYLATNCYGSRLRRRICLHMIHYEQQPQKDVTQLGYVNRCVHLPQKHIMWDVLYAFIKLQMLSLNEKRFTRKKHDSLMIHLVHAVSFSSKHEIRSVLHVFFRVLDKREKKNHG